MKPVVNPGLTLGAVLLLAVQSASGFASGGPTAIASGAQALDPRIAVNTADLVVVTWRSRGELYAATRVPSEPWDRPRRLARAVVALSPDALAAHGPVVALAFVAGPRGAVRVARWTGRTWLPRVGGPGGTRGAYDAQALVGAGGNMRVVFGARGSTLSATRSSRGWRSASRVLSSDLNVSVAAGPGGQALVGGSGVTLDGDQVVASVASGDGGFAAPEPALTLPSGTVVTSTAAAVRRDGRAVVVASSLTSGLSGGLVAVTRTGPRTWGAPIPIGSVVRLPGRSPAAVTLRLHDAVVAAWRQVDGRKLRLYASAERNPGGASWRPPTPLTPATERLGAPDLVTATTGRTYLTYPLNGRVYLRSLGPASANTRWSPPRLLSGAYSGCVSPHVAATAQGEPVVAFVCGGRLLVVTG